MVSGQAMLPQRGREQDLFYKSTNTLGMPTIGRGLAAAIKYVRNKATEKAFSEEIQACDRMRRMAVENGVTLYSIGQNGSRNGDCLINCPPLVPSSDGIDATADQLEKDTATFDDEMTRRGLM